MISEIEVSFSTLHEVQKCFNSCKIWQKIIENQFEKNVCILCSLLILSTLNFLTLSEGNTFIGIYLYLLFSAKILVVGGHLISKTHDAGLTNLIEIIDLINTELKTEVVVDENGLRGGAATGGILWNQPVICGGYDSDGNTKPNVSIIGAPKNCFEVMIPRKFSSSVVLNKSKIWVTGGISDPQNAEMSTEIISLEQTPVPGPDLPFGVNGHSMVHVNPTTVYFIGGSQNKDVDQGCDNTWIFDPTNNFQIKAGPSLNIARLDHTCSKMRIKGKIYLVVAKP